MIVQNLSDPTQEAEPSPDESMMIYGRKRIRGSGARSGHIRYEPYSYAVNSNRVSYGFRVTEPDPSLGRYTHHDDNTSSPNENQSVEADTRSAMDRYDQLVSEWINTGRRNGPGQD